MYRIRPMPVCRGLGESCEPSKHRKQKAQDRVGILGLLAAQKQLRRMIPVITTLRDRQTPAVDEGDEMTAEMVHTVTAVRPTVPDLRQIRMLAERLPLTEEEFQRVLAHVYPVGAVLTDGTWTHRDRAWECWGNHYAGSLHTMMQLAEEAVSIISGQRDRYTVDGDDIPLHWDAM